MYQVSAWNIGGEGELSEQVYESAPQGKWNKDFLKRLSTSFSALFCLPNAAPRSIAPENINVSFVTESDGLHIRVGVSPHSFILWL